MRRRRVLVVMMPVPTEVIRMPIEVEPSPLPPLGGLRALVAGIDALAASRRDGVLCVVVGSSGSTYRKPGALILLDAAGVRVGTLSGGCLEAELEARARDVLANGSAQHARFDTSGDEDRVFGSGTGCGGSTDVLLLPLSPKTSPLRSALRAAIADDLDLELVLVTGDTRTGTGCAVVGGQCYAFDECGTPVDVEAASALLLLAACAAWAGATTRVGPSTGRAKAMAGEGSATGISGGSGETAAASAGRAGPWANGVASGALDALRRT